MSDGIIESRDSRLMRTLLRGTIPMGGALPMFQLYRAFCFLLTVVLGVALLPVASNFFIELAKERGLYENPSQRMDLAMTWVQ